MHSPGKDTSHTLRIRLKFNAFLSNKQLDIGTSKNKHSSLFFFIAVSQKSYLIDVKYILIFHWSHPFFCLYLSKTILLLLASWFVMFWPDNETLMYYYYFTIVNNSPTPAKQFLNHRFSRAPMYIFPFRHDFHRCLPEPVKAQEFLKKLTNHLYQDANIFALFERVADPDISCKDCSSAGVSFFTNQPQPKQWTPYP